MKQLPQILFIFILFGCAVNNSKLQKTDSSILNCKYESNCNCKSPGPSARWEVAYCMYKLEISDFEVNQKKLIDCSKNLKSQKYMSFTACEKNNFWRKKICSLNKLHFKSKNECLNSDTGIPNFIKTGP